MPGWAHGGRWSPRCSMQKGTERMETPRQHRNARRGGRETERTLCLVSPQLLQGSRGDRIVPGTLRYVTAQVHQGHPLCPALLRGAHSTLHPGEKKDNPRKTKQRTALPRARIWWKKKNNEERHSGGHSPLNLLRPGPERRRRVF